MEGRKEEGCEEEERCGGLGGGELKDGYVEEEGWGVEGRKKEGVEWRDMRRDMRRRRRGVV